MTPFFEVSVGGVFGIAGNLKARNVSLTFTDSAGFENDKVSFVLADDPPSLVPPKETALGVTLGYRNTPGVSHPLNGATQFAGIFYLDEASFSKPPAQLTITAHANYTGNNMKETKDRDFHDTTLGDIVSTIAEEHGMEPVIEPSLAETKTPHEDQANVSDMQFLTDIAGEHDAVFKIAEDKLYFGKKGQLQALSGVVPMPIIVHESDCTQYSGIIQERSVFTGVYARYTDLDTAEEITALAGEEGVTKTLPHKYQDEAAAQDAADGALNDQKKEAETFSFTCVGNPYIVSEAIIILVGFRPGIRTIWRADTVTHNLSTSSYTTQVECKLPDAEDQGEDVEGRE
jgi:phage protein D